MHTIIINRKPVSWNQAYRKRGRGFGMYMTKEAVEYKNFVKLATRLQVKDFTLPKGFVVRCTMVVCLPEFITKKNTPSKTASDLDNLLKTSIDSICDELGFDDSAIFEYQLVKVYKEVPRAIFHLETIPMERYHSLSGFSSTIPTVEDERLEITQTGKRMLPKLKTSLSPSRKKNARIGTP